jgi:hypothetical protein
MTNFTQDLKSSSQKTKTEQIMSSTTRSTISPTEDQSKITILASSFSEAAIMFHKQNLSAKGYRLTSRIESHRFYTSEGSELSELFEGKPIYAVTFEYDSKLVEQTSTN